MSNPIDLSDCVLRNFTSGITAIIGSGGKTGLMRYLALEIKRGGGRVIATTTTKLSIEPPPDMSLIFASTGDDCRKAIKASYDKDAVPVLVRSVCAADRRKVIGFDREWLDALAAEFPECSFLVEADGSAGKSLKGHLFHEPVIPHSTRLLLAVMGADVIGKPLTAESGHRVDRICEIIGELAGSIINVDLLVKLLLCPEGYLHNCPPSVPVIPVLNKIDCLSDPAIAARWTAALGGNGDKRLIGVASGSILHSQMSFCATKNDN